MKMTKIQFDTIRRLAHAYGHEWAVGLDFAEVWPRNAQPGTETTTRGAWSRERATPAAYMNETIITDEHRAEMALWQRWCDLHDSIASGHVPTIDEIEAISEPLFLDDHCPSTPKVRLRHETCTRRTRWDVLADGEVRFEFCREMTAATFDRTSELRRGELLARARVWIARNGQRVAMVDALVRMTEWGGDHYARIVSALVAAGCSEREARRAVDATEFGGARVRKFDLAPANPQAA